MSKIAIIIDSLYCGGAERDLVTLLSMLDYSKTEIDLLLVKRGGMFEELLPPQIGVCDALDQSPFATDRLSLVIVNALTSHSAERLLARLSLSVGQRFSLKRVHGAQRFWQCMGHLIEERSTAYDVAVAFSQGFPTYYVAQKIKARKKIAVVNVDYIAAGYSRAHDFEHYDKFDTIVADSNKVKEIMQSTYPEFREKLHVIHHILDAALLERLALTGETFEDGFEGIRLLTIGRLVVQKGYDIALKACHNLKQNGLNVRWYVLGEGHLRRQIEQDIKKYQLQGCFVLLGAKLNPYPYLKDCDLYVQTSRFEGFGIALAEARMLNKPIVTTNFDVVHEQVENERNGLIVEMDPDSVCGGIIRLIRNQSEAERMVNSLKKEKKRNFEDVEQWQRHFELMVPSKSG